MDLNIIYGLDDGYDSDFDYAAHDAALDLERDFGRLEEQPATDNIRARQPHTGRNIIDLTGADTPPDNNNLSNNAYVNMAASMAAPLAIADQPITVADCLQMILNVLPDVSITHVSDLISDIEGKGETGPTPAVCERIIMQLLDSENYPKERDEMSTRKRKRGAQAEAADSELEDSNTADPNYHKQALDLLKDEFPLVPVRHLENTLLAQRTLSKAHGVVRQNILSNSGNNGNAVNHFMPLKHSRPRRGMEETLTGMGSPLPKELEAARKRGRKEAEKRRKAADAEQAEQDNRQQAQESGEITECLCCFDDFPMNRMTSCSGDTIHFVCMPCAKQYAENEMGLGRVKIICFADSDCGGTFSRRQLQQFLGEQAFDRLEHLQQQQELAAAGLDFLSECPFCDFKAEYPPVEFDREFRCLNPKCEKVSCRLCQSETHIPLSCEEFKKDNKLSVRHQVEEAMSAALIRSCNKCKFPFVKMEGCNKMTCTRCANVQCYVCSKNVAGYEHFSDGAGDARRAGNGKLCPLHDNVETRHEEEVKKAAEEAMVKAKADNPDVSDADLVITVSETITQAEAARQQRAQAVHAEFPYRMANGVLAVAEPPARRLGGGAPEEYRPFLNGRIPGHLHMPEPGDPDYDPYFNRGDFFARQLQENMYRLGVEMNRPAVEPLGEAQEPMELAAARRRLFFAMANREALEDGQLQARQAHQAYYEQLEAIRRHGLAMQARQREQDVGRLQVPAGFAEEYEGADRGLQANMANFEAVVQAEGGQLPREPAEGQGEAARGFQPAREDPPLQAGQGANPPRHGFNPDEIQAMVGQFHRPRLLGYGPGLAPQQMMNGDGLAHQPLQNAFIPNQAVNGNRQGQQVPQNAVYGNQQGQQVPQNAFVPNQAVDGNRQAQQVPQNAIVPNQAVNGNLQAQQAPQNIAGQPPRQYQLANGNQQAQQAPGITYGRFQPPNRIRRRLQMPQNAAGVPAMPYQSSHGINQAQQAPQHVAGQTPRQLYAQQAPLNAYGQYQPANGNAQAQHRCPYDSTRPPSGPH